MCRVEEVLLEVDERDLECQSNGDVCSEVLKVLVDLCRVTRLYTHMYSNFPHG